LRVELEIVEAALTLDRPTLCSFWQRHDDHNRTV
jgi:hypothetical protein